MLNYSAHTSCALSYELIWTIYVVLHKNLFANAYNFVVIHSLNVLLSVELTYMLDALACRSWKSVWELQAVNMGKNFNQMSSKDACHTFCVM